MAADAVAGETGSAEFGILGPLEVLRSGRAVPLGGPRQRAVLAMLLLEANRVVSMDRLAEDVWAGHPPEGWATTLQTYVFHLRRALEPDRLQGVAGDIVVTRGRGYLLRVDREHLDAALFQDGFTAGRAALQAGRYGEAAETLRRALDLWRSPVLADLADYAFTRPEAVRLEELRLAALEARIEADLALDRHDALTAELEQLVAGHPLRERLHGQLMLALYRCGRQADALAAYRRVRDLLAAELGIDPGEPLQRLHASVLAHDPALDWDGGRPAAPENRAAGVGTPAPRPPAPRLTAGRRELDWVRRRARRLLAVGAALAVAAAVCIVAVARPWAGEPAGLPGNSVGLIDSAGGRVGAAVAMGSPDGLAYGDGSVWAVNGTGGTVSRIDPATHAVVQQVQVGVNPAAVTVTGGDVWVTNSGDGTVSRINAAAGAVVQTIQVGNIPDAIASGPSGIWVADQGDATVDRIDPATGRVTMRDIPVGGHPDGIAVGPDAVWVANGQDGTVTRIDPATGQPGGPLPVGAGPEGIAITPDAVWVANSLDLSVDRLDPATGRVAFTIPVGDGPSAIAAASDGVWVSDEFGATLARIDPHTNRVSRVISLGSTPRGIVATGSGVWVAARPFAAAGHFGGTLTEVSPYLPQPDPAHDYDIATPALAAVYDGLVAFRKAGGARWDTLVPDLAVTLPRPVDGGRTYTFTLRRGIRYSNGAPVRASDFRRGIQRELSFGDVPAYFEGILGAPACFRNPRRCDLSAGIVTDDAAGAVTFRLSEADPDFLDKLALVMAAPAPPGAAGHFMDRAPFLPGTGPYMVSRYRPDSSLTLVRNPGFRQWSYAAQPTGYPDVIRFEQMAGSRQQESAVAAGRADVVDITLNGLPYRPLAIRYPTRVHSSIELFTTFLFLNTRRPPFTNIKARQAVNYAIDRARMIQLLGLDSPGQAAPTCQLLPAGSPSYEPYCPYTAGPQDGTWHGPDMEKARQLAKESGTTNVPVTVWNNQTDFGKPAGAYLAGLLKQLGYRATVRNVPQDQYHAALYSASHKVQLGVTGWAVNIPTTSDFFLQILTCRSIYQDPAGTANLAGFCDPQVDRLASQAQAAQPTDPAGARKLWAKLDRTVTDQAPLVPVLNTSFTVFVSARVGNYQESPSYGGPLLDQIWIR
jgi:ABC-type transport system substrate-binding protein/DNA-binding SARP family transcriptional activator